MYIYAIHQRILAEHVRNTTASASVCVYCVYVCVHINAPLQSAVETQHQPRARSRDISKHIYKYTCICININTSAQCGGDPVLAGRHERDREI